MVILDGEKMINNIYITNNKQADVFMRQLLNIGEAMYQVGGEISRIEDSLHRLGKVYGGKHISVYALTSSIVITAEFENDYSITQSRRIQGRGSIDCKKLEKLNQLCRDCVNNPIPIDQLQKKVLAILSEKQNKSSIYIGQIIAATAFSIFFGGNLLDAVVAALGAGVICLIQHFLKKYFSSEFFYNLAVSFITGVFVNLIGLLIPSIHVHQILIGDIMILIPGIAITTSIRYIFTGDIVSSFEKLVDSLIQTFGIALGFMLSFLLFKVQPISAPVESDAIRMLIQVLAAGVGTLGFSIVFNLKNKYIPIATFGGIICWASYLFLDHMGNMVFVSTLISAMIVGVYGEGLAHIIKVPTTILFIPVCLPLIPGGNLYYMALSVISSDWDFFWHNLILLTLYAVGIALGLAIVMETNKIIKNIIDSNRSKKAI